MTVALYWINLYGFKKGYFLSLFIASPMDLQFGLWCFCSVNAAASEK